MLSLKLEIQRDMDKFIKISLLSITCTITLLTSLTTNVRIQLETNFV